MISRLNKPFEFIKFSEVENYFNTDIFELYIEDKKLKLVATTLKFEIIKFEEKKILSVFTIYKNYGGISTMKIIKKECDKIEISFKDFILSVVNDRVFNCESIEISKLIIKEIKASQVFNPFKKYNKVSNFNKKFNKLDVIKILMNGQFSKIECTGKTTDDSFQDDEDNYSRGLIGHLYLANKIIESRLPVKNYFSNSTEINIGYHWLNYKITL